MTTETAFVGEFSSLFELLRVVRMMLPKADVFTALVTGRKTELQHFQISPDPGFHRKGYPTSSLKKADAFTALVTGRKTELLHFQISPNHGFHKKGHSSSLRKKADALTALVTGRRTELRRFQISPGHGFHKKGQIAVVGRNCSRKKPRCAMQ